MAMSRKHYREAAEAINRSLRNAMPDTVEIRTATAREIANDLADMFKRDNRAFRREQFMDACGLGDPNGN